MAVIAGLIGRGHRVRVMSVGETDFASDPKRLPQCFSPAAWQQLAALKQRFDPNEIFYSWLTQE